MTSWCRPQLLQAVVTSLGQDIHRPPLHQVAVPPGAADASHHVRVEVEDVRPGKPARVVHLPVEKPLGQSLTPPLPGQTGWFLLRKPAESDHLPDGALRSRSCLNVFYTVNTTLYSSVSQLALVH